MQVGSCSQIVKPANLKNWKCNQNGVLPNSVAPAIILSFCHSSSKVTPQIFVLYDPTKNSQVVYDSWRGENLVSWLSVQVDSGQDPEFMVSAIKVPGSALRLGTEKRGA